MIINYQNDKVVSIVTREIKERIAARKRNEQLASINHDKRDWVNVSYEQKEDAKLMGCRWCPLEKRWYASPNMSSVFVERWLEERRLKAEKKAAKKSKGN